MMSEKKTQTMKPATAAQKLGILLEAAPEEFQSAPVSRTELAALEAKPPAWLVDLRANGPHPKQVVAAKLGVSISGLVRGAVTEPLTSAEIQALLQQPPAWLVTERATQYEVREEQIRVKDRDAERARKIAHVARQAAQNEKAGRGR
ncbi:hypothetical protein E3T34_00045 [Cryobacterium sp. TMT1-62]|uniref:Uncharacterized protein n=2 Tax=Microbacteriaceae TaxID=85023 RepID=A0ABY2JDT7_9MICO|nr:hypothetical protein E3N86_09755 [Cryobacterium sp. Hz7]TFD03305.1 hypothetical protein E3T25_06735 [Cryobacterium sandaracinum]TFD36864.1 hypothetical protein E3T34_00045 [Cryobacterium sp. TMT1-62]